MSSVFSAPGFCMLVLFLKWTDSAGSIWWFKYQWSYAQKTQKGWLYVHILKRQGLCNSEAKRQLHRYKDVSNEGIHLGEWQSKLRERKKILLETGVKLVFQASHKKCRGANQEQPGFMICFILSWKGPFQRSPCDTMLSTKVLYQGLSPLVETLHLCVNN